MRFHASMVVLAAFLQGTALAQTPPTANATVKTGPAPAWAEASPMMAVPDNAKGLVFVRRQDTLVHLDDQGETQYLGYRIKLLHSNALQLGNISIGWNPASGAPVVHAIRIYRGAEVIDVLAKASFEVLRREDQLEMAKLDGILTAVLHVPDLRVGDELEVALTTPVADPTLGKDSAGVLALPTSPAQGRYAMAVLWSDGHKPKLQLTPDLAPTAAGPNPAVVSKSDDHSLSLRFDNPAPANPPNKAPMRYQWQRAVEYSDFGDWADLSRRFAAIFAKASQLAKDSPIRQEAKRIAAAYSSAMDRASAALKLVQQDVRYIYIGLNNGNLTPAPADETWNRRYGDCKGKSALLLALLRELGVEAEAVLVNSAGADDGLDARLPSPKMFDHVLVRAHINGQIYYLDGTLPPVVPPSAKPVFPVKWTLPLLADGSGIDRQPWSMPRVPDEVNLFEMDASKGFTEPAHITSTSILRGVKGLQQQIQFSGIAPNDLLTAARQNWIGDTWQTIDTVDWHFDQKAQASVLTISGTGKLDWSDDGNGERSLPLPGGGFSPPERRLRSAGQDTAAPFYNKPEYDCRVTSIRLPADTRSRQWSTKAEFDTRIFGWNYYRAFELRGGVLRMLRGLRTEQLEIDPELAKRDNDRIAAFDNSMAMIFYDPQGRNGSVGSGKPVPATNEIDWTGDNVPCLSAATLAKDVGISGNKG